jgi:hypothetical protein
MEEGNRNSGLVWYLGAPMTTSNADDTARRARENFVKWIEWYLEAYPEEAGSQEKLAPRIGVTPPAISAWRKRGSTRYPNMRNLIRFHALVNKVFPAHMDQILFGPPPRLPHR